jgi:hypothetical protein
MKLKWRLVILLGVLGVSMLWFTLCIASTLYGPDEAWCMFWNSLTGCNIKPSDFIRF